MAAISKISYTNVVNELLAFVQNRLDVVDEVSIMQICTSNISEAEITAAKAVLEKTAVTIVRLAARPEGGQEKKDLQDLFSVFKETDPDYVPSYVAKDAVFVHHSYFKVSPSADNRKYKSYN